MALRRMLEAANNDASFTSQEKGLYVLQPVFSSHSAVKERNAVMLLSSCLADPEEFLNKLFQLLRVEPLLKIRYLLLLLSAVSPPP